MNIPNSNKQTNKKRFGHICYQCNIPFRTNMKLQLHIKTSGHYPKRKGKNKAQANLKALKDTPQYTMKDFCNLSPNERGAILGLEYVLEYRFHVGRGKKEVGYFCKLCMYDASLDRMVQHITGFRHRKIFLARKYPFVMKAVPSENSTEKKLFLKKIARQIEKEEGEKTFMVDEQSLKKKLNKSEISALKALSQTMPTKWSIEENTDLLMKTAIDYSEELEIDSDSEVNKVSTIMMQMAWRLRMYALRASPYNPFPERVAKAKEVAVAIIDWNIKNTERPEEKPDDFHIGTGDRHKGAKGNLKSKQK
ncbi:uncharacterized protein LOC128660493 [Bombina bombina]|uniref:uncharacterized protein LOC128660493 n=1 Tax=Bombina bombina TaxID=8345 RepID=UPI00235ADC9D|nr:uncharacterized protein LOC128660493 [Bombina bombina]